MTQKNVKHLWEIPADLDVALRRLAKTDRRKLNEEVIRMLAVAVMDREKRDKLFGPPIDLGVEVTK